MLASLLRIILLTATLKILERGLDKGPIIPDAHGEMYLQGPVMAKACFYEGRLVSITIFMNGGFEERVRHISHRYGTPRRFEGLYVWEGPYTTMLLGQDDKGITLMMLSNVLKKIRM